MESTREIEKQSKQEIEEYIRTLISIFSNENGTGVNITALKDINNEETSNKLNINNDNIMS